MTSNLLRAVGRVLVAAWLATVGLAVARGDAAEPEWRVMDSWVQPQGIPFNGAIRALVQTRDGYIWIGAKAGLVRFDGVNFKVFDARDPAQLRDDEVRALAEDVQGGLWIGTFGGGVSVLRDGRFTVYTPENGLPNGFVNVLAADRDGGMWIGTDAGLAHFRDGRFEHFAETAGNAPLGSATALHVDATGELWIGTLRGGVYRFAAGKFVPVPVEGPAANTVIYALHRDAEGRLWVGTLDGVFLWGESGTKRLGPADGFPAQQARAIRGGADGTLWFGTNAGIVRHKAGRFTRHDLGFHEQAANNTYALCLDREGNVWGGAGGLVRLRPALFAGYTERDGLSYNLLSTLVSGSDGALWIGTGGRGLNHFRAGKFTASTPASGLPATLITGIAIDGRQRVWVGTEAGLYRSRDTIGLTGLEGAVFVEPFRESLPAISVRTLLEDRTGAMWVATNTAGLVRIDPDDRVAALGVADGLPDAAVRGLCEARDGTLWLGTRNGLAALRDGKFRTFGVADGVIDASIENLFLDRNDVLWICTRRGISRLENGKFSNFTAREGLYANFVIGLADDDAGNLWLSGSKGVFRASLRELADVAAGRRASVTSHVYGREHGLESPVNTAAGRRSIARTPDGTLWFGMSHGLYALNPRALAINPHAPPVHLEAATIDGEDLDVRLAAVAPPGRGDLAFRFTAPSFTAPDKVRFRYRLDGYDPKWVDAGERRAAFYSNIPPGDYAFRVVAANGDGVWNDEGVRFAFRLRPHFYQTYWFFGACGLLGIGAVVGLHRARLRALRRRETQLVAMVEVRTKDLHARTTDLQREIEEHARTEAELRHYKDHLEEQVTVRTKAWRESREMLQSVIDSVPALVYMKDTLGRFLFVNGRYAQQRGLTADDIVGKTVFDLHTPEEAKAFVLLDKTALASRGPVEAEDVVTFPDGTVHTFLAIRCALRNESGEPYAVCGISTDISHVKQMEEQLRHSQKMEAIGRLAGGIAHDFNNLLTGINGYSALALADLDSSHPLHDSLRQILKAGERAADLTRQLLAYSRKQMLVPQPWNLNTIMNDMEALLKRIVGEDVQLATVLRPEVGVALVDRSQIEQIILNLAVNARDAMPNGGRLVLETARVVADEAFAAAHPGVARGAHVMLAVRDAGHGMSAAVKARLFEPFFTTKEVGKGTGLGLSVVYGIVQQSGGAIEVESEEGDGTTFRIYFPEVPEPRAETRVVAPAGPTSTRGSEGVLLVEDEEFVRNFGRHALEAQGYRVLSAASGAEAMRLVRENPGRIDLVLTDVVMPDMGGRELAELLRKTAPGVPILFMSGYSAALLADEGMARDQFLQKPFDAPELARRVRAILDRAASPARVRGAQH